MFMPFSLSASTVPMACFCVRHLHNSQGCQKRGHIYCAWVCTCMCAHTCTYTHSDKSQHQCSGRGREPVAILFLQGMVSSGEICCPLVVVHWFHLPPAPRSLRALAREHGVHISRICHWATWWQGFSCCHYTSPSFCLLWETDWEMEDRYQNVDIQNISEWQNDIYQVLKTQSMWLPYV